MFVFSAAKIDVKMGKYTKDQWALFRSKTTEELIRLLQSDSSTVVYRSLVVLHSHKLDESVYGILKNINDNGKTFNNRRQANSLICRFFPKQARGLNPGESTVVGYVYFIQNEESGAVKIGRTNDLERRVALFSRRFPFSIKLLQHIHTLNFEKIELTFHHYFDKKRLDGEWFKLDEMDIDQIKRKIFPAEIETLIVAPERKDF